PRAGRRGGAGLGGRGVPRGAPVGRPQPLYTAIEAPATAGRDYRLLAEILAPLVSGKRGTERARALAEEWGRYLLIRSGPRPGVRLAAARNLALLQEALAAAGFDPRFRRRGAAPVGGRRGGRAARLPVPRPRRGPSRAGVRRPPGPAGGHAREPAAAVRPARVPPPRRTLGLPPRGRFGGAAAPRPGPLARVGRSARS